MEGSFYIDCISLIESSTTNLTLVSMPITDLYSDAFETYLDPALFGPESLECASRSSLEVCRDAKTFFGVRDIK